MRFDGIPVRIAPALIAAAAIVDDMDARAFARLAREIKPGVRLTADQRRSLRILGVKRRDVESVSR